MEAGRKFDSFEELSEEIKNFESSTFSCFSIKSSESISAKNKRLKKPISYQANVKFKIYRAVFACCHHGETRHRSESSKRLKTRSTKWGCNASFTVVFDDRLAKLRILKADHNHNHELNSAIFSQERKNKQLSSDQVDELKKREEVPTPSPIRIPVTSEDPSETMQAVQYTPGGPHELYIGTVPVPEPQHGEVLIKVAATAINRADTLQRKGNYKPPPGASDILGLEAAGSIHKLGPDCPSNITVGKNVMALLAGGGNAEYVTCPWQLAMDIPQNLDMVHAAAIPEVWLTAYMLLFTLGRLAKQETVLIHAGASGVGGAAIQMAVQAGATAIVTAGSADKIEFAKSLGATAGINYKEEAVGDRVLELTKGNGVNLILDCVGASMFEENLKSVSVDGRWMVFGLMGGAMHGVNLGSLLRKRVQLVFTLLRSRSLEYKAALVKEFAQHALPLFENKTFLPNVQTVMTLSEIREAHTLMEQNKTRGKIVLQIQSDVSVSDVKEEL